MQVEDTTEKRGIVLVPGDIIDVGVDNWIKIMTENNLNLLGIHTNLANLGTLNDLKNLLNSKDGKHLLSECKKNNIDVEYELHILQDLLPRELFETHPEYFPMDTNGIRKAKKNICFTSEGVYQEIEKNLLELCTWIKPTTNRYYLWTDDVKNSYCHCEHCKAYSPSDQVLLYENRVLKIIRKVNSKATVAHLAYNNTLPAPQKVKPLNGVFLEFAPIKRNYAKPLDEKHLTFLKENLVVFNAKEAHILEYWLDASMFSRWRKNNVVEIPWDISQAQRDIKLYRELGIQSITSFCIWVNNDYYRKYGYEKSLDMFREYGNSFNNKINE